MITFLKKFLSASTLLLIAAGSLVAIPEISFAQNPPNPIVVTPTTDTNPNTQPAFVPLTNLPGLQNVADSDSLAGFFNQLYRLCIGAAAVIAVLQIMRAGALHMFNKGSLSTSQNVRSLIQNSVLGLLLVLSPAIVFGIINPDILDISLDFSQLKLDGLQSVPTAGAPVANAPQSCQAQYDPITIRAAGQQCSISPGSVSIPSTCCVGMAEGGVCCGRPLILNENPSVENEPFVFNYVTEELTYDDEGSKCVVRDTRTFATLQACTSVLSTTYTQRDCGTQKCQAASRHTCTAQRNVIAFPTATEFDRINGLPSCPQ